MAAEIALCANSGPLVATFAVVVVTTLINTIETRQKFEDSRQKNGIYS
jgi:hypothetical protein